MNRQESFRVMEQCGKLTEWKLKNGKEVEVYLPENPRQRLPFENEFCQFTPVGWARLPDGVWYPLGYKLLTTKLASIVTDENKTPQIFPIGEWICVDEDELNILEADNNGLWAALRKGGLKNLKTQYEKAGIKTKYFLTAMYNPVFASSTKVKAQGMMVLKEAKSSRK